MRAEPELVIGLVDDDQHVVGNPVEEVHQFGVGDGRPGGVVGGADEDHARPVGDGGGHCGRSCRESGSSGTCTDRALTRVVTIG